MNSQYLLEAVIMQRDSAMNQIAQAAAQLREKDDQIERLKAERPKKPKPKAAQAKPV